MAYSDNRWDEVTAGRVYPRNDGRPKVAATAEDPACTYCGQPVSVCLAHVQDADMTAEQETILSKFKAC